MNPSEKVFVIVFKYTPEGIRYLALKPNPEPGRNTDYYVVTGGVEKDESFAEAAKREVSEEIGITPIEIVDLNYTMAYTDHIDGLEYREHCYAVQIDESCIKLNEEHIDYKWFDAGTFINTIWWEGDKRKLVDMIIIIEQILQNTILS